jgi:hypothetical protein
VTPPTAVAEPEVDVTPGQTAIDSDETVGGFDENPEVARHEKLAEDKDAQADALIDNGDEEGANILRIEADDERSKAAELRENAGEATGQGDPVAEAVAAERRDVEAAALPPEDIIVSGIAMGYPNMGGKKPTSATLKLVGGKVNVAEGTAFKKGQTIAFSGVAVVNFVGQKDKHDAATQQVTGAEARHEARITDLVVEVPEAV